MHGTTNLKVTKVGVIVRYTKKVIEKKKRRLGSYLTPGGRLRVKVLQDEGYEVCNCSSCNFLHCLVPSAHYLVTQHEY